MVALGWTLTDPRGRAAGRLPKYNPAVTRSFSIQDWQHVCNSGFKKIAPRGLTRIAQWIDEASHLEKPRKRDQDRLDACICLLVGLRETDVSCAALMHF